MPAPRVPSSSACCFRGSPVTDAAPGSRSSLIPPNADLFDKLYEGVYFVDRDRKIQFWNRAAQSISGFSGREVVGRHCFDNILGHVDEDGRTLCRRACPLAQTMEDGRSREARVY